MGDNSLKVFSVILYSSYI